MKQRIAYYFLAPAFIFLIVFLFIPFVQVISYSFMKYNIFEPSSYIGLKNYVKIFSDEKFLYALLNSVIFLLVTPILIVISLSLAITLRENNKINKFVRSIFFLPVVTPIVIAGIFWKWIFTEDTGILNYLLSLVGIKGVAWLTEYPLNLFSVMIVTIWRGFGYYLIIFISGLLVIPKELEEACILDGATKLQKIYYIILPIIKPVILFVLVISSAAAIKIFTEIYVIIPGTPLANKSLVFYMYKYAFERFDFGIGSAAGVIIFLITLGFSILNIKLLSKDTSNE